MPFPDDVCTLAKARLAIWRDDPGFEGETMPPCAQWYVDGICEATIVFPPDDGPDGFQMAKGLHDITGTLGMMGDGVVVVAEMWMKTYATDDRNVANIKHGDLAKDPAAEQALMVMKITADTDDYEMIPFGVGDDGRIVWGESRVVPNYDGFLPRVIREAQVKARPMHATVRSALEEVNKMCPPGEQPVGEGSLYRGVFGALANMGDYVIAVTDRLMEMP